MHFVSLQTTPSPLSNDDISTKEFDTLAFLLVLGEIIGKAKPQENQ